MIHLFVLALGLTSTALGQSDCGCQIPLLQRARCTAASFTRNRRRCELAGCCWDNGLFSLMRCYQKDSRYCPNRPSSTVSCFAAFPPQACGFGLRRAECEARGCCFDQEFTQSCLVAAGGVVFPPQPTPSLSRLSQWTQWSACSVSCSPGLITRTRQCVNSDPSICTSSGLPLTESVSCNNELCQRWGGWNQEPCPVSCGSAFSTITRNCVGFGSVGPEQCYRTSTACQLGPCPAPVFRPPAATAAWTQWSQWSGCFPECAPGTRTRTRECSSNGGPVDESLCLVEFFDPRGSFDSENCNLEMCASWSRWERYSRCPETCGDTAKRFSTRACINVRPPSQPSDAFTQCSYVEEPCNLAPCPVAPLVTEPPPFKFVPGSFKSTDVPATTASSAGETIFEFVPPGQGVPTTSPPIVTTDLNAALWGSWRPWSGCSVSCGEGNNVRTRRCQYRDGFQAPDQLCGAEKEQTIRCNEGSCREATAAPAATRTLWGEWTKWSECSVTCGPGTISRTRLCRYSDGAQAPDNFCGSGSVQSRFCNDGVCNAASTPALTSQTVPFNQISWGPWLDWTDCSVTCDAGFRTRTRHCQYSDGVRAPDESCGTENEEKESCNEASCATTAPTLTEMPPTVAPSTLTTFDKTSWGTWKSWSACSATCDVGSRTRSRRCQYSVDVSAPTFFCGTEEDTSDDTPCFVELCETATTPTVSTTTTPVPTTAPSVPTVAETDEASWGKWLEWSDCSATCSPGFKVRNRVCKGRNGRNAEGECKGSPVKERACNAKLCPEWEEWMAEDCTVTCASDDGVPGIQVIRRQCKTAVSETAAEKCYVIAEICSVTTPCPEQEALSTTTPPVTTSTKEATPTSKTSTTIQSSTVAPFKAGSDIWAQWGDWSSCSTSCAPGIQSRARRCHPNVPPQFCVEGALDTKECNTGMCTGWSQWRTQPCDVTCGEGGSQLRRRICLSGQSLDGTPDTCYKRSQPCEKNPPCEVVSASAKLDVLFLVDSSTHVDKCDDIEEEMGLTPPLRAKQLTKATAPTYTRMKKFMKDFVNGWGGISDDGTRISIQLFSNLCSPKRRSNLHLEKRFNESNTLVEKYIDDLPYLCGEYWLDWALQCAIDPVMTTDFGDRENVPNVVVAILSNAPTTSQPSERLLSRILKNLVGKGSTMLSATATPLEKLGPKTKKKYEENTRKISCSNGKDCSAYLGSIWDLESLQVVDKIRAALQDAGVI